MSVTRLGGAPVGEGHRLPVGDAMARRAVHSISDNATAWTRHDSIGLGEKTCDNHHCAQDYQFHLMSGLERRLAPL